MSNENLKPRNDRFNVDHKHLARELREAGIWPRKPIDWSESEKEELDAMLKEVCKEQLEQWEESR